MNPALAAVAATLARHPELAVGILFGSVARNDAGADSDLDVAVAADHALSSAEKLGLLDELALAANRPVDLLDLHQLHGPILSRLLTEGRLVLRRPDSDIYPRLILRAIADEADFLPYRRRILDARRRAWTTN
jgi:predicted nucleotidyltransferase